MRCKVGDLAVIARTSSRASNCLGRLLTIIAPHPRRTDAWRFEPLMYDNNGNMITVAEDRALRPLRDDEGEDETLTWKTKEAA